MIWMVLACNVAEFELRLGDEHNYLFSSSLQADSVPIAEGQDASLSWKDLDRDFVGGALEADQLDELSIIRFPRLSQEEVLLGINNETLKQSDLSGFVEFDPSGITQAPLTAFSLQGTHVDPELDLLEELGTFLLLAEDEGKTVSLMFIEPTTESTNTAVEWTADSVALEYEVDLEHGSSIESVIAQEYYLDWSEITLSGTGNPLSLPQLDSLLVAGFERSLSELERDFLRLESLADQLYIVNVVGQRRLPLSRIQGFQGFNRNWTWLIALRCSLCLNPAPLFVGHLSFQ